LRQATKSRVLIIQSSACAYILFEGTDGSLYEAASHYTEVVLYERNQLTRQDDTGRASHAANHWRDYGRTNQRRKDGDFT
jgi:hypothetical protein